MKNQPQYTRQVGPKLTARYNQPQAHQVIQQLVQCDIKIDIGLHSELLHAAMKKMRQIILHFLVKSLKLI